MRTETGPTLETVTSQKRSGWRDRFWMFAFVVTAAVLVVVAAYELARWLRSGAATTNREVAHVSVVLPDGDELAPTNQWPIALSEDATHLAYCGLRGGKTLLFVRTLSDSAPLAQETEVSGHVVVDLWLASSEGSRPATWSTTRRRLLPLPLLSVFVTRMRPTSPVVLTWVPPSACLSS